MPPAKASVSFGPAAGLSVHRCPGAKAGFQSIPLHVDTLKHAAWHSKTVVAGLTVPATLVFGNAIHFTLHGAATAHHTLT